MGLRSEEEIKGMIKHIEEHCDSEDEDCYLDEGEQAALMALYWVLGEDNI